MIGITLGGRYMHLRTGEPYTVLEIESNGLRIRWLDERGWEDYISKSEHLVVLKRLEEKKKDEGRFTRMKGRVMDVVLDYCTMGYLARHGYLYCQMPVGYEKIFVDDYSRLSDERPNDTHYNIKEPRDDDWFALSSSIAFGATVEMLDQLDFGEHEVKEERDNPNRWRVCSNKYFYALISLGFSLGGSQSYERIMKKISYPDDRAEFKRGFELRD